ncbi:hypothetical protein M8542_08680 [Amycolatopsis sp. OK19-0408]|uniref:DUF2516 family protein n=1 Tax=Amycolatopsis iheyensis TaxID=2945988 RepID=A0A9X2N7X6_9PSEU|nr:hypothetical protein [Amycolatopsis iheyensis]MCR6482892.1 hypothetical protein [Amycolatopsis iheyensis]
MFVYSIVLADGEGQRAAVVGWIVLAAVVVIGVLAVVVAAAVAGDNLLDALTRRVPAYRAGWFGLLIGGLGLVALGFVLASFGLGLAGGVLLFLVWQISDRSDRV